MHVSLSSIIAATAGGFVHGAEPTHAWPLAATYASQREDPIKTGIAAAASLVIGHLLATAILFGVILSFKSQIISTLTPGVFQGFAGGILVLFGVHLYTQSNSQGEDRGIAERILPERLHVEESTSTAGLALFAFLTGFARLDKLAIIGLCVGSDTDCLAIFASYGLALSVGIIGLTLGSVKLFDRFRQRLEKHIHYGRICASALFVLLGIVFIWRGV